MHDPTALDLAQQFHDAYERLAPDFKYSTREASAKPWSDVPPENRALMIAVAQEILDGVLAPIIENARLTREAKQRVDEILEKATIDGAVIARIAEHATALAARVPIEIERPRPLRPWKWRS